VPRRVGACACSLTLLRSACLLLSSTISLPFRPPFSHQPHKHHPYDQRLISRFLSFCSTLDFHRRLRHHTLSHPHARHHTLLTLRIFDQLVLARAESRRPTAAYFSLHWCFRVPFSRLASIVDRNRPVSATQHDLPGPSHWSKSAFIFCCHKRLGYRGRFLDTFVGYFRLSTHCEERLWSATPTSTVLQDVLKCLFDPVFQYCSSPHIALLAAANEGVFGPLSGRQLCSRTRVNSSGIGLLTLIPQHSCICSRPCYFDQFRFLSRSSVHDAFYLTNSLCGSGTSCHVAFQHNRFGRASTLRHTFTIKQLGQKRSFLQRLLFVCRWVD
jgi:hypothetical protein